MASTRNKEAEEQEMREWHELVNSVENASPSKVAEEDVVVDITVAEVLGVGHCFLKPPEVVVVRDTEGRVWKLNETHTEDGNLQGLVSRHSVKEGIQLRLRMKKMVLIQTDVFQLTPTKPLL